MQVMFVVQSWQPLEFKHPGLVCYLRLNLCMLLSLLFVVPVPSQIIVTTIHCIAAIHQLYSVINTMSITI